MIRLIRWILQKDKRFFIFFLILNSLLLLLAFLKVGNIIWGDARYYYAYTRSIVIDHDLDFSNEAYRKDFGFPNKPIVSIKTGKVTNPYSPGAPLLWVPGFLLGQSISFVFRVLGLPVSTDGYSIITQLITGLSCVGFVTLGFYLLHLVFRKHVGRMSSLALICSIYATTQLFYYSGFDPLNSHTASFLFASIIVWYVDSMMRKKIDYIQPFILGLFVGWLALIRNQDIVVIIPLVVWILNTVDRERSNTFFCARLKSLRLFFLGRSSEPAQKSIFRAPIIKTIINICLMVVGITIVMSIQLMIVWYLYGQINSPYLIQGTTFNWLHPNILYALFSRGAGFFRYAPIAILCLFGLIYQLKRSDTLRKIGITFFLLQLYIISSWTHEIVGGPYGSRMFISSLPWLSLGLVEIVKLLKQSHRFYTALFGTLIFVLFLYNILQTGYMIIKW
jgi:hypothetical protein